MVQTQKKRAKRCSSSSRKIEGPGCSTGLPWEKRPETTTPEMLIHKMLMQQKSFWPCKVTDSLMLMQQKCEIVQRALDPWIKFQVASCLFLGSPFQLSHLLCVIFRDITTDRVLI